MSKNEDEKAAPEAALFEVTSASPASDDQLLSFL